MKKRKNDFYILITYVVIFLGSLSSLYFYDDLFLNKEIKKSDEKLIARVMSFQREVKYKHKEQIRWNQIERDKKLYLNDSLYTGERSKVTFLSNNTQITLFSSSLITFRGKSIELGRGNIVADIDKGEVLDLSVNGEKLQVKGGGDSKITVKSSTNGKTQIHALSGKVKIKKKLKELNLEVNQVLKLEKGEEASIKTISRIKLNINLLHNKYLCSGRKTLFSWKRNKNRTYQLNLFDPITHKLVSKIDINRSNLTYKDFEELERRNKAYELQVLEYEKDSLVGISKKVYFVYRLDIQPDIVSANKKVFVKGQVPEFKLTSSLSKKSFIPEYVKSFSLSRDGIRKSLKYSEIKEKLYNIPGKYEISSCIRDKKCGGLPKCRKTTFVIRKPNIPTLIEPKEGKKIYLTGHSSKELIRWKYNQRYDTSENAIKSIRKYQGRSIEKKISFSDKELNKELQFTKPGIYELSIVGYDDGIAYESKIKKISVFDSNKFKSLKAKFVSIDKDKMIFNFKWEMFKKNNNVKLRLNILDELSESLLSVKLKKSPQKIDLPIKKNIQYYGVVLGNESDEVDKTKITSLINQSCIGRPLLKNSNITNKYKLDKDLNIKMNSLPFFEWSPVKWAKNYKLSIFEIGNGEKEILYEKTVSGNSFIWKENIQGDYLWEITPMDFFSRNCESSAVGTYSY